MEAPPISEPPTKKQKSLDEIENRNKEPSVGKSKKRKRDSSFQYPLCYVCYNQTWNGNFHKKDVPKPICKLCYHKFRHFINNIWKKRDAEFFNCLHHKSERECINYIEKQIMDLKEFPEIEIPAKNQKRNREKCNVACILTFYQNKGFEIPEREAIVGETSGTSSKQQQYFLEATAQSQIQIAHMDQQALSLLNIVKCKGMENKWHLEDCRKLLPAVEDELILKHSGPDGWNCIRAAMPVPVLKFDKEPTIAYYFEVEILKKHKESFLGIHIGFCNKQFPAEGECLGNLNTFAIIYKRGALIDGSEKKFGYLGGFFKERNVIGLGLIESRANLPMEYFVTCDGELLGKAVLPPKFAVLRLFPAVDLKYEGESIRTNFGKEEWQFTEFERALALSTFQGKINDSNFGMNNLHL